MAANDKWFPASNQDLRIVLIGKTGTGKSTTGNTLIGGNEKVFKSSASRHSVTKECSVFEKERFGNTLVVVDTPGVLDTTMTHEQLKIQLIECTQLASPGVHAFLIFMKIGQRDIANEDSRAFDLIKQLLGEEFLTRAIVVFTGKEILDLDGQELNEYMSELPDGCKKLMKSCKGGVVAISNTGASDAKEQEAERVIDKVKQLVQQNGGNSMYYKNVLFDERNKEINKRMERILKPNYETNNKISRIQMDMECIKTEFKNGKPTEDQRKHLQSLQEKIADLRETLIKRENARLDANKAIEHEKMIQKVKKISVGVVGVAACVGTVAVAATSSPTAVVSGIATVIASSLKR